MNKQEKMLRGVASFYAWLIVTIILTCAVIYFYGLSVINEEVGIPQKIVYKTKEVVVEAVVKEVASRPQIKQQTNCEKIYEAMQIAKDSGEYEVGVYDCSQFSRRLVEELEKRGFWGTLSYGYNQDGTPHVWVGIQAEPMVGGFLKDGVYIIDPQVGEWDRMQNE